MTEDERRFVQWKAEGKISADLGWAEFKQMLTYEAADWPEVFTLGSVLVQRFVACPACAAVVDKERQDVHREWHRTLKGAIRAGLFGGAVGL